jgi:hypothetical protein
VTDLGRLAKYMEDSLKPGFEERDHSDLMDLDRPYGKTPMKKSQRPVADRGKTIIYINQVNNLTIFN